MMSGCQVQDRAPNLALNSYNGVHILTRVLEEGPSPFSSAYPNLGHTSLCLEFFFFFFFNPNQLKMYFVKEWEKMPFTSAENSARPVSPGKELEATACY